MKPANIERWVCRGAALLLAVAAAGGVFAQSAPFSAPAPVSLTPSSPTVPAGSNVTVEVIVDLTGITGRCNLAPVPAVLGGYAIPVNFDRNRLRFVSSAPCTSEEFNAQPITTTAAKANSTGQVSIASTHSNQLTPVGRVCVASLTFQATVPGSTSLLPDVNGTSLSSSFQTCGFTSSGGPTRIPATVTGTEINVGGDQPVGRMSIVPVVASARGAENTFFRTALQLHNAGERAISGKLVFHRAGFVGSPADPSLAYTIAPGHTLDYPDLLPAMGLEGVGSLDILSTNAELPAVTARIFNDSAANGTTGLSEGQVLPENALSPGDRAVLICPRDPAAYRYNVGVRTLGEGATLRVTLRGSEATVMNSSLMSIAPNFYFQQPVAEFVGMSPLANDVVLIEVESGSAIVYGATTDNVTGDPAMKLAERVPVYDTD
jgi:hypothetical protein